MSIKNNLTIIQKELFQYATSFSNFVVLAAVMVVIQFLFWKSFFDYNVAQLNSLFSLFPWVFALLVPAVTMGVVAAERKNKTLQLLLASPISEIEIVLGKFISAFIFLAAFPLITIVTAISLSTAATLDWGVIASAYLGSLLLLALILAMDLWISSFFTNQLAAFMISFLANFGLMVLGSDLINQLVPLELLAWVSQISPFDRFDQISSGLIRSGDILYFVVVEVGFLFFAYWQILRLKFTTRKFFRGLSINTIGLIFLGTTFFTNFVPGEWDVTQLQIFTLAHGTKTILQFLENEVTLNFYLSQDLPPAFQPRLKSIDRMFEQLSANSGGKLKVARLYPADDPQIAQAANELGIFPQAFSVASQSEYQVKEGYLGLDIKYQDDQRTIPFISQLDDLELQVMSRIHDLTQTEKPQVLFLENPVGLNLQQDMSILAESLRTSYAVETLNLSPATDSASLTAEKLQAANVLVLADGSRSLHTDDLARIRERVQAGASLLVFDDGVDLDRFSLGATKAEDLPVNNLLKEWGIQIKPNLVYDLENANLVTFNTNQGNVLVNYAFWPTVGINPDIPLFQDLGGVVLPWPSSIETENEQARELLFTGQFAGFQEEIFDLNPKNQLSEDSLAVQKVGVIRSRGQGQGAVIVIGTPNILSDQFISSRNNNLIFISQIFDLASQNDALASIRAKNRLAAQLMFADPGQKDRLKYTSLVGLPLVFLVGGGIFTFWRKRKLSYA